MNHSETLGELFSAMSKAQAAIRKAKRQAEAGRVRADGEPVTKPAQKIAPGAAIEAANANVAMKGR